MKIWKKGLAVLLILVLAVSLCACGEKEEDKLVGTWKCEYDMSDVVAEMLGSEASVDATLIYPMVLTLNADYTFSMKADGETFLAEFHAYMDKMVDVMLEQMCESMGMSMEEVDALMVEQYGMNAKDFAMESMAGAIDEEQALKDLDAASATGTFSVKDGKLVMVDEDGNTEESAYTLEGDTLTLEYDGMEIMDGLTLDTLVFKKAA